LGLTYTQIGTIALVAGTTMSLSQPFFGYLSDRQWTIFGRPWQPQLQVALSVAWIGLAMGLVGLAGSFPLLLLAVGLGGLGSAAFHPPGAAIALASSGARKATGVSIFSVGGNLGAALSPLAMAVAIGWIGLRGTVLLAPMGLLAAIWLYRELRQADRRHTSHSASRPLSRHSQPRFALGLALIVLIAMARSWYQVSLMTYLPIWIQHQGHTIAVGGQFLFLFLLAVSLGSLTGGALSDRIGHWQVLFLSMALLGPAVWLFIHATGVLPAILVAAMGFLLGSTFPVAIVMAQEAWPGGIGMASGLVMGLGWLPGGIGASFTGYLADHFSLESALQTLVVPPVLGAAFVLLYAVRARSQNAMLAKT
jgi:MFS transporter, FSR family, fosmidomycin resistance protein